MISLFAKTEMSTHVPGESPVVPVPLTYRERLAQFKILEEKRHELIEVPPKLVIVAHTPAHNLV